MYGKNRNPRTQITGEQLRWFRRLGMGFLFTVVLVPFDLIVLMAVLGAGVYICLHVLLYLRQSLASHRKGG